MSTEQVVICVAGMHRSGTSAITRALNLCGMDLGPDADLMPASPANPEGYWEHLWFNYLNNLILTSFGGSWDVVPAFPAGWEADALEGIRASAEQRIAAFKSPVWGWKDPRNTITLPVWLRLIPHLKVVACLRNPLDVARSLNKRGSTSVWFGLQLWWQYNSMLLLETAPQQRHVTHFDIFFQNGQAELRRLLAVLGLPADDQQIQLAAASPKESLRHSASSLKDLIAQNVSSGLVRTYCRLITESGEIYRSASSEWDEIQGFASQWDATECCEPELLARIRRTRRECCGAAARNLSLERELGAVHADLDHARHETKAVREALGTARHELGQAQGEITAFQQQLTVARTELADNQQQLATSNQQLSSTQQELQAAREQTRQGQADIAVRTEQLVREQERTVQLTAELAAAIDSNHKLADELHTCAQQRDEAGAWAQGALRELNYIKNTRIWRMRGAFDRACFAVGLRRPSTPAKEDPSLH